MHVYKIVYEYVYICIHLEKDFAVASRLRKNNAVRRRGGGVIEQHVKEELDSGGVLSASSARIAYDYSAGNTAYTARQRLADTDSMGEEKESPRARLDTSSTHLRRRV